MDIAKSIVIHLPINANHRRCCARLVIPVPFTVVVNLHVTRVESTEMEQPMSPYYVLVEMHANRVPFYAALVSAIWIVYHPLIAKIQVLRLDLQRGSIVLGIVRNQKAFRCQ